MDFQKWTGVGRVRNKSALTNANGRDQVSFNLEIVDRRRDANGAWNNHPMVMQMYAYDVRAGVMENHVVEGQELLIEAKYVNWEANGSLQHAFIVQSITLGFKPRNSGGNSNAGNTGTPPL